MALRDSKLFRIAGYIMSGFALSSFVLAVILRVAGGGGTEIYHGGRGLPISNVAALVTIAAVAVVLFTWLATRAWQRWRHLLIRSSDA